MEIVTNLMLIFIVALIVMGALSAIEIWRKINKADQRLNQINAQQTAMFNDLFGIRTDINVLYSNFLLSNPPKDWTVYAELLEEVIARVNRKS